MPKVNAWDVIRYVVQGAAEDITHKKAGMGVGKWNDMVVQKKKKAVPKPNTPPSMTLDPDRIAQDVKKKRRELQQAEKY